MLQTDKDSIKIELKGFRRRQAGLLFDVIIYIPVLWLLFMVCIEAIKDPSLLSIPLCGLMAFLIWLFSLYIHEESKQVIYLESVEGGYRATKLLKNVTFFHPDQVSQVQEGYGHIVLVLKDGKKLDFIKTDRIFFGTYLTIRDDHIWIPFFKQERFPNASYKTLRYPR